MTEVLKATAEVTAVLLVPIAWIAGAFGAEAVLPGAGGGLWLAIYPFVAIALIAHR